MAHHRLDGTRIKKKKKDTSVTDLLGVSIVALIAVFFYDDKKAISKTGGSVAYIFFLILIMIAAISVVVLLMNSRKNKLKLKETGGISQNISLDWGQNFQHTLLLFVIPIIILIMPIFTGQTSAFDDFLQAILSLILIGYLKKIYWGKIF